MATRKLIVDGKEIEAEETITNESCEPRPADSADCGQGQPVTGREGDHQVLLPPSR